MPDKITVITETSSLESFCAALSTERFITVDTEFMREKTYYPQLCLIQVAGENNSAAIDALSPTLDLKSFYELLNNPAILKVFHACRQDIEIFYHASGSVPAPVFDTQIAAMVCGYGESVSYETLINKTVGIAVDKSMRFTDWSKRPLSDKQLIYALNDVLHLRKAYAVLEKQISKTGRSGWIKDEMYSLIDPAIYDNNPDDAWKRLRLRSASPRYLALVQAAARWREQVARERNVPRSRVMKDEIVTEIAHSKPKNFSDLQGTRGFYPSIPATSYEPLFGALKDAESLPTSSCPTLPPKPDLRASNESLVDLLRLLLKHCANANQVVPRMIADKEDIELLAIGKRDVNALKGWRYEIFGKKALELLEGKMAIKSDGKNGIVFIED